jgi:hypothetical protein
MASIVLALAAISTSVLEASTKTAQTARRGPVIRHTAAPKTPNVTTIATADGNRAANEFSPITLIADACSQNASGGLAVRGSSYR